MTTDRLSLRSRVAGGVVGFSLVAAMGVTAGLAQESEATPEANATPPAAEAPEEAPPPAEFDLSPQEETRIAEQIQ